MGHHEITTIRTKTVAKRSRGSPKAGSMRASTAGTNSNSGATTSTRLGSGAWPANAAATGAPRKNTTNTAQNTSGGTNVPGAYEAASHDAITTRVASAPARCS